MKEGLIVSDKDNIDALGAVVAQIYQTRRGGESQVAALEALIRGTEALPFTQMKRWATTIRWSICQSEVEALQANLWSDGQSWLLSSVDSRNPPQNVPFVPWLEICSADGFRREKAFAQLKGAAPSRFLLALAMRTLNDWVPQVRMVARKSLLHIARASPPALVADAVMATLTVWGARGINRGAAPWFYGELPSAECY
ncbi:MAG: hypothetical protein RSD57_01915 [Comamonas sp.]